MLISLKREILAGVQFKPPIIQKPTHSLLAKVVREENVMRQPILGHHVELLNTCDGLVIFLGLLSLTM